MPLPRPPARAVVEVSLPMTWLIGAAFFVACAGLLVWQRGYFAELQSLLAGGSIGPGCVIAEAVVVLLLAGALLVAYRVGL
jgi:hypothetical protein